MLIDAGRLPSRVALRTDVAVVGSGPAGITVAQALDATGHRVMLLELGPAHAAHDGRRELRGSCTGDPFPLVPSRDAGFGGASRRWRATTGLRTRPLDHVDFVATAARATSWPFDRTVLDRWFEQAADVVGTSPDYDPAAWFPGEQTALVSDGGFELATFQFASHRVFVRRLDDIVRSARIELVVGAAVTGLHLHDDGSAIRCLTARTVQGNELTVDARVVVLAAGALENARLLLQSPGATGAGVGNEHDQVGRYFMDHISLEAGTIVSWSGSRVDASLFVERWRSDGRKHQAMLWPGDRAVADRGLLNAAFWINELDGRYQSTGVDAARRLRDGWRTTPRLPELQRNVLVAVRANRELVGFLAARVRGTSSQTVTALRVLAEQAPDRCSRVSLGTQCDRYGRRRVSLHWRIASDDLHSIRCHQDLLAASLEARGVGTLVGRLDPDAPLPIVQTNYHHLGGTRMHVDRRQGVVDPDCRVHGIGNLFVVGGSVFPTGGYVNPTLTIIALALRAADRISRELAPAAVGRPV